MWIAKDHYLSGVVTTITEDEYKDLAIDYLMPQDYFENFVEACAEMLKEYGGIGLTPVPPIYCGIRISGHRNLLPMEFRLLGRSLAQGQP